MKILYYSPHPHLKSGAPTGYGTHIREMVSAWRRSGIEVKTLIAGDLTDDPVATLTEERSIKRWAKRIVPSIFWESLKDYRLMRFDRGLEQRLESALADFEPDCIYERVAYLQNSGVRVAHKTGTKHVAEINAPYPEERESFSGKSWFLGPARNAEREILARTSGVVVVSSALKEHFDQTLPGTAEKTLVVPNSVHPQNHSADSAVNELAEKLGLAGHTVIGFVGSIFPYHGVDLLIDAFAAQNDQPSLKLLIVGDGESLPSLKAKAKKLGVLGRVVFAGSVPHQEVYAHIELMDICCMAKSNWYGSPVKIFEYGLMKKPVIAPNVSPIHDVMGADCAVIVDPEATSVAEGLRTLIRDRDLRERIATNWHREVLEKYTWDVAAKKVLDLCA